MRSKQFQFSSPVLAAIISLIITFSWMTDSMGSERTRPNEPGPVEGMFVNTYTGNFFYARHDISIPGRGMAMDISFYYNSGRSNSNWGFGNGWSSSFGMHYVRKEDNILIESNDGQRDEYVWSGSAFLPPPGKHFDLSEYEPGKFILKGHHGFKYYFDDAAHGKITAMEDRNGNTLTFSYSEGKISRITDTAGRIFIMEWEDNKLIRITDNNEDLPRVLTYGYDEYGNMISYTDPLGNTTLYDYADGKMVSITDARAFTAMIHYDSNHAVAAMDFPAVSYQMAVNYDAGMKTTTISRQGTEGLQETVYHFDDSGVLTRIVNPDGGIAMFEWDEDLNLTAYTDENGNRTEQFYDDHGNITRQVDAMGNEMLYTYEPIFNLVLERTDKLGNSTQFSYDASGNLLTVTDPAGNSDTYAYNSYGSRTQRTDRNGNTFGFSYNNNGDLIEIVDPMGNSFYYSYDNVGNKLSETDPMGNTTSYAYDLMSRLISTIYPDGYVRSYSYDPVGNRISETDQLGTTTFYIYDPMNRLLQVSDPLNSTIEYSYDPLGNRISETDKNGNVTNYSYDHLNRLVVIEDALNFTINYSYDPVGNRISETDANGNVSNYSYDPLNRLVNIEDAMGNVENFVYDAEGNLVAHTDKMSRNTYIIYDNLNRRTKKIDPMGHVTLYFYDPVGNLIYLNDPNEIVYSYSYDPLNRLISETMMSGAKITYSYDPVGNRISETDAMGNMSTYSYDSMNRLLTETDPAGFSVSYSYDPVGNRISETNKNGNITGYSYDALNRLVVISDALNNNTSYSYDNNGNRTRITNPLGHSTSFTFDPLNRVIGKLTATGNESHYEYDGTGALLKRIDPNGAVTDFEYDPLNRLTTTTYPAGRVERSYDPAGNLTEMVNIGIGLNDRTLRTYDNSNRLISESISYGTFSKTVSYSYDNGGRITSMTDPDGNLTIRNYTDDNRLVGIHDPLTGLVDIISDLNGNNTRTNLPNGEYQLSEYDTDGRLIARSSYNPDGTPLFDHDHSYDAYGNRVQSNKNGLPQANFSFDALNRLSTANYPWAGQSISYEYDAAGNRVSKTVNSDQTLYTYNDDGRVLSQVFPDMSSINYSYDNNGNVIQTISSWGTVNYSYDFENRLTRIEYPDPYGIRENYYSPEGRRLARNENGEMKYYFPTLFGNILEMDQNGNTSVHINPGISISRKTPSIPLTPGFEHIFSYWGDEYSTTEFTSNGLLASFEFDYFGAILSNTGDIESVDPGLYASGYKVDWDPILGAELIGIDYAPDIDQHYGNLEYSGDGYFEPGSEPFEEHVYEILADFYKPGQFYTFGPENIDNTPGVNGSDGSDANNKSSELCGNQWKDWVTTGSKWVYMGAYVDKSYLPQKRIIYKYEKKKSQVQFLNVCLLEKGPSGHHQKSYSNPTGKSRLSSYSPKVIKRIPSGQIMGPWPKKKQLDKWGKEKEKELNR